ncbi:four helix bundle protein [Thalassobellus suaedae]|uniref:Four helix bundle protein n=1 Tax=Thalassobellus suaedae TaxID=3074124 RepID=A0ABY9XNS5_9FLAO|nr:four helix bundle protein [Flavobacteriaceae bacterium HL-DH14]WNH12831.1 four helix bundle protein [Flavobacteriaceae bacterium HL-DH10]
MKESILKSKSYDFAIFIVKTYKIISSEKKELTLSRQLLKSGTSIGANIREAEFAQSSKDFISKMSIALKEANETEYWLLILKDTNYIELDHFNKLMSINKELIKMLVSTINTMKSKLK